MPYSSPLSTMHSPRDSTLSKNQLPTRSMPISRPLVMRALDGASSPCSNGSGNRLLHRRSSIAPLFFGFCVGCLLVFVSLFCAFTLTVSSGRLHYVPSILAGIAAMLFRKHPCTVYYSFALTEGRPPGQRPSLSHAAFRQKKPVHLFLLRSEDCCDRKVPSSINKRLSQKASCGGSLRSMK